MAHLAESAEDSHKMWCVRAVHGQYATVVLEAYVDGPPCQLPIEASPALRSNVGPCIAAWRTSKRPTHGHGQVRSRRSVSALHSIGGCFFCLIDIPFRIDDDLSGQGPQVDTSGLLRSNGRA